MTAHVTATAVLRAIRAATDEPAYVEQTGGGCATVYVGTPNEDGRYRLAVGPGSFDWGNPDLSIFNLGDLYVGPDDDGESPATTVTTLSVLTAAARRYVCSGCERTVARESEVEGLLVEEGGDIPASVWCLDCVRAMSAEQRDLTHDEAVMGALHTCTVWEGEGAFCRWCGVQMLWVGSAGYQPVTDLDLD